MMSSACARKKNFEMVKKLGADSVFDYHNPGVNGKLRESLKRKEMAGVFDAISVNGAFENCVEVIKDIAGNNFVVFVRPGPHQQNTFPEGVEAKFVIGSGIKDDEASKLVFEDFLPEALAKGSFVAAPEPEVVGKGLESVQAALDVAEKGVSARKLVVTM